MIQGIHIPGDCYSHFYEKEPPMFRITDTHYAATWLLDERAPKVKVPTGGRRDGK